MLQNIHHKKEAPRASSLYCRWLQENRKPGAPLVAVWMDSEMRAFEPEFVPEASELLEDALDEPGGVRLRLQARVSTAEFTTIRR